MASPMNSKYPPLVPAADKTVLQPAPEDYAHPEVWVDVGTTRPEKIINNDVREQSKG
ncbi:hypothetical protein [Chitinophaga varians]|uniref:hypothetical protein n=1 Tax=Chitinophaga varians TaxID=2202339 RepID=UPI00165F50D6|nr:hypothetical protein [Chitinophaga varians]MBC9915527.1 hypothetical protein [Chitinophaga varians]